MWRKYIYILLVIFALLLVGYFGIRNIVLQKMVHQLIMKAETNYQLNISCEHVGFVGFKTVRVRNMLVTDAKSDTIFQVDTLMINPKILPMLFGKKRMKELDVFNGKCLLTPEILRIFKNSGKQSPVDSLFKSKELNFAKLINSFQDQLFTLIPGNVSIKNTLVKFQQDTVYASFHCLDFKYIHDEFYGDIVVSDNYLNEKCRLNGFLSHGDHIIKGSAFSLDSTHVKIPFIGPKWQTQLGFDTLQFSASFDEKKSDLMEINGRIAVSKLVINDKRIGPEPVVTNSGGLNFKLIIGKQFLELDSTSEVRMNAFTFSPYLRFEYGPSKKLSLSIPFKEFKAQDLFESFPSGLFSTFSGIKTEGNLAYHLKASIDFDLPDSVQFESRMENKGFKVIKYGQSDFRMMNGPFIHDVYEKDVFVKSILVSPENSDFVSVVQISPFLKFSVLTAEDGDFFYHKGFNERAFRESIATNMKENRFARGGSTISMQLVKNVFLNRKKTISRKVEEAFIVWMIENMHLTPKERMFEVYLNIIEWGPGIYGIKPAARFYFNKTPGALTLSESIFLSSLIPRPKGFKYTFESNGVLREYLGNYFKLLGGIMVRRNQINPSDTLNLLPKITLTGEARKYLATPDSLSREDSIYFAEPAQFQILP